MWPIRITSKRADGIQPDPSETIVDVDRTNPILGNPHVLKDHRDRIQRADVIERYRQDLEYDWAKDGPMRQAINLLAKRVKSGERLTLRCWCAPRPCHAELIAEKVALVLGQEYEPPVRSGENKDKKRQMGLF